MNNWIKACLAALMCAAMPVLAGTLTFDTYYHNDHLGSPVAATDERSDLLWRAHFRPYGERQESPADAAFGNVGYTGHMQDADSGMVYMQARYYDPLIGRFMAVDPVGVRTSNPMSFNRYLYGSNNPQKYVDPDGRIIETAWDIANIAMGAGSTAANIAAGNYGKAAIDAVGVVVDTAAMVIPGVPGGAGAGIKALREGGERLAVNKAQGKAGEAATRSKLGDSEFAEKVSFLNSDGKRAVPDFLVRKDGGYELIETKTGGALLSSGQKKLFDDIAKGIPVTPVGKNAARAGLSPGQPLVLKGAKVDRPF